MISTTASLSNGPLELVFASVDQRFKLEALAWRGISWLDPHSPSEGFAVHISGRRFTARDLPCDDITTCQPENGMRQAIAHFAGPGFRVEFRILVFEGLGLIEVYPVIHNNGTEPCHINRVDSFSIDLPTDSEEQSQAKRDAGSEPVSGYDLLSFTSDWGQEFEPQRESLATPTVLETRWGRSSKGAHPWFALYRFSGGLLSGSIAWSGNWAFRFDPLPGGGLRACGGLNNWEFGKDLRPGESMEAPHAILAFGNDLNEISRQYALAGRRTWYPTNPLAAQLPVEWNHWWSYEDGAIDEDVFMRNLHEAANLGIELCTLDAGWFGPPDSDPTADNRQNWFAYRGDWDVVNTRRFPNGIRPLSDAAHALGLRFGLWCEIEGLGRESQLARAHPEFTATRDGQPLGYVCLGNPQAGEWAYHTLARLAGDYACDWIKLDFNVDPCAGCNRTDHGHGPGDGLFEHYRGYYELLDRFRRDFPQVVLEACSSGGLRIDLGMLRHTHLTFLSDPDWPTHDLQIFWGASSMLAPEACLHWSFSDWRFSNHPQQTFNPNDPALTRRQLDFYTRIAMLGAMGFSQRLPDLPAWVSERLAYHIRVYRQQVGRFVQRGTVHRLTGQPRRNGIGERWAAFQYSLEEEDHHLLFVFRLAGAEPVRVIRLTGLRPDNFYRVETLDGQSAGVFCGKDLMDTGLMFEDLLEEDSEVLRTHNLNVV